MGGSLGAISHIKLSQGAVRGNPPVSLSPGIPASWFPEKISFPPLEPWNF